MLILFVVGVVLIGGVSKFEGIWGGTKFNFLFCNQSAAWDTFQMGKCK